LRAESVAQIITGAFTMNCRKTLACLAPAVVALLLPALAAAQTVPVAYVTNQTLNVVHMFRTTD